jgi:hypothetical protein
MNDANVIVVAPIVHLNGTSREQLLEVREAAYAALDEAYTALKQTAPNGRDYYPEPGLLEKAQEQHSRRLRLIDAVMTSLQTEMYCISETTNEPKS